jgi:hypothetical protein
VSKRASRHRAPPSASTRRFERKALRSFIVITFMLGFLVWFAVVTDNVLLVTVSTVGAVIGTWLGRVRKTRRRKHVAAWR